MFSLIYLFLILTPCYSKNDPVEPVSISISKEADALKAAGHYRDAILIIKWMLADQRAKADGNKADLARVIEYLGELEYLAGQYADAKVLLTESFSIKKELYEPDDVEMADAYKHLGVLFTLIGEYGQAEDFLKKAIKIGTDKYGSDHPSVAESLVNLARLRIEQNKVVDAESLIMDALAIQESALGLENPNLMPTLNTLAWFHIVTEGYGESEACIQRALAIGEKNYGPEHPHIADSLYYLGCLYFARGELEQSVSAYQKALEIRENFLGPKHPDLRPVLGNLSKTYLSLKQLDKSKWFSLKSFQIWHKSFELNHPAMLREYWEKSPANANNRRLERKISSNHIAPVIRETLHGSADLNIADQNFRQARDYISAGRLDQAEPLLIETLEIYENALAAGDRNLSNRINDYMDLHRYLFMRYFRKGQYDEADEQINRAKTALENHFHADDQTIALFLNFFASLYKENKLLNRAIPFYILMIDQLKNHPNKFKYRIAEAQQDVGNMYFFTEQYDKAEHYFQQVLDYCEKTNIQNPELCCNAMNNMGTLKSSILASEEAITWFNSALSLAEKTLNH